MNEKLDNLSKMRVRPRRERVQVDNLRTLDCKNPDELYDRKLRNFLTGNALSTRTRVRLSDVSLRDPEYDYSSLSKDLDNDAGRASILDFHKRRIRAGYRPPIELYFNRRIEQFVCPDSPLIYEAYDSLGVSIPPAEIIGSHPKKHGFSGFQFIQYHDEEDSKPINVFQGAIESEDESVPSLIKPSDWPSTRRGVTNLLDQLVEFVSDGLDRLRTFHSDYDDDIDHHDILCSYLVRINRIVENMEFLCTSKKGDIALILLRSLYEMALSFNVYWLYPDKLFRYFQSDALMSRKAVNRSLEDVRERLIRDGVSRSTAQEHLEGCRSLYSFATYIQAQSEISPLSNVHESIYSKLSSVSHQDFVEAARFEEVLRQDGRGSKKGSISDNISEKELNLILEVTTLSVSMIYVRLMGGIGQGH